MKKRVATIGAVIFGVACVVGAASYLASGCSGWDPRSPFERNAPAVDQALADLDAGRFTSAEEALESYLSTGPCTDAGIGLPDAVRQKYNGSFDLGLVLFSLAEKYGHRFGEEEMSDGGSAEEQAQAEMRSLEVDCALIIARAIAEDPKVPIDLRARAHYLAGNLEFLRKKYEEAVKHYDDALELVPGLSEDSGADGIGRDAAWNRAIALRRIEDQKDAGNDADQDANQDADQDAQDGSDDASDGNDGDDGSDGSDGGEDGGDDGGGEDGGGEDGGGEDAGQDGGKDQDAGGPDGGQPPPQQPPPQPASPEPQRGQEDRILDQFEEAPTYQEEEAKRKAGTRRGRVMEDK